MNGLRCGAALHRHRKQQRMTPPAQAPPVQVGGGSGSGLFRPPPKATPAKAVSLASEAGKGKATTAKAVSFASEAEKGRLRGIAKGGKQVAAPAPPPDEPTRRVVMAPRTPTDEPASAQGERAEVVLQGYVRQQRPTSKVQYVLNLLKQCFRRDRLGCQNPSPIERCRNG